MARDGQCRIGVVAIAIPDHLQARPATLLHVLPLKIVRFGAHVAGVATRIAAPFEQIDHCTRACSRQSQVAGLALEKSAVQLRVEFVRVHEHHPEAVIDHIQGNLPTTYRPLDEVHDGELGFLQQEAIARAHGQSGKGCKRIAGRVFVVAGHLGDRIVGREKQ